MTKGFIQETGKVGVRFQPQGEWKIVLCNGMIRSASTWSYNVVLRLMRAALAERVYGGYDENIARFLELAPPAATYRVLKCHILDPVGRGLVQSGEAIVVFTCRNLADAAASFMRMFHFDFEHTFSALAGALDLYQFHRRGGKALILGYREITAQPLGSVAKIAEHLGVNMPVKLLEGVAEETSMERARERVAQLKAGTDPDSLIHRDRFVYDRETLLNLDHIRDGRSGYGRALLTEQQASRLNALAKQHGFTLE